MWYQEVGGTLVPGSVWYWYRYHWYREVCDTLVPGSGDKVGTNSTVFCRLVSEFGSNDYTEI